MVRLAEFSRDRLTDLRDGTGIEYDQRKRGTLQVLRTQKQLDGIGKDVEVLRAGKVPFEVMDGARCAAIEPGLGVVSDKIVGGLHLPNDETGDCFQFTTKLGSLCAGLGVKFRFETTIERLNVHGGAVAEVITNRGTLRADAYVVALGSYSGIFVRPLGICLPVYPLTGYYLTVA